ncbi:permease [Gemmatirosa kalamazoonensis]|uniref:Permease n=1 Tax=Gemmatirosa kalamazoonensis TaxID=861299 RepID=W0R9P6_9BACT|nr:ABC transporter permease [Gemmatirosa kalamazoonensis]AHG87819.1 permease [Gemmatirosa kalamazoonensis]
MLSDFRIAARRLRRAPGFTTVALLTLALGIGATTAIFSVVNGVLLRPPPYPEPDRLVVAWGVYPDFGRTSTSLPDFLDWRDGFARVGELAAIGDAQYTVTGDRAPERANGAAVTANYFHVLGIAPVLGRDFVADDERGAVPSVVILGNEFWRRHYGADPAVVGKAITLNGISRTIIGVAPAGLEYPASPDLLVPQRTDTTFNRRSEFLDVLGRLKPGVTVEQARATLAAVSARLAQQYPQTNARIRSDLGTLREELVGPAQRALWVFMGAAGLVLLVACANAANLLLARAAGRAREVALVAALGAGRRRVFRQLLVESLVLSVAGGALGVLLASLGVKLLAASHFDAIPRLGAVQVDGRVLGFALAVSVLTGLLFGVVPAMRLSSESLQGTLRAGGRSLAGTAGGRRTRDALVLAEVAMAVVLLVGAALLARSFQRLLSVSPGFDAEHVLTARVSLPRARYPDDVRTRAAWDAVLMRVRAVPGVTSAALTSNVPFAGIGYWSVQVEGRTPDPNRTTNEDAQPYSVTDGYFKTLGIRLVRGRVIDARDRDGAPYVAVINTEMAKRFWPGRDPIGGRVSVDGETWCTVVGVVADTRQEGLGQRPYAQLYFSAAQLARGSMFVAVRGAGDPSSYVAAVRNAVAAVDPELPVYDTRTLAERLDRDVARPRVTAMLVALFAAVALALAAVGIYGVVAYGVAQRAREFGIRMALGARPRSVVRLVVGQGTAPVLAGLALGLGAAWGASRVLGALLYGVSATDPVAFIVVTVFLGAVALVAAYVPARRATRVDPVVVLAQD